MDGFDFIFCKAAEAQLRLSERSLVLDRRKIYLPPIREGYRAMPNHLARSSIFSPVARGKKEYCEGVVLPARSDAIIHFTGEQLDEVQADLWMQLVHEARTIPLGCVVKASRANLLRSIGKNTSGENYAWLARAMATLGNASFSITTLKNDKIKYRLDGSASVEMLSNCKYNSEQKCYDFVLSPCWGTLFSNREYALIDWAKRLQIGRGQDMAKALQRLVVTSNDTIQRFSLEWLQPKLAYRGRLRDFRQALLAGMKELERVEIVVNSRIERSVKGKEQAVFMRLSSTS